MRVDLLYERIEKDLLVVYTERLGPQVDPISVAIVSMKMTGEDATELEVVVQIVALTVDVVDGYRQGTEMALDNLKAMFD